MLYAAFTFVIVFGVTAMSGLVLLRWWPAVGQDRLWIATPRGTTRLLRWREEQSTGWQRVIERLGRALGPQDTGAVSRYRARLLLAGYHDPRAIPFFVGAQVALAILAGYAYTLYGLAVQRALPSLLPVSFVLAGMGFFLPELWLRSRIRARQREIVHALPDILDCLLVCVEAGMAFDAAVARVAAEPATTRSPLHEELMRMHLEVRAGRPREEAFRTLAERTGVQDVKALVSAFIQTSRLGTPLGKTLRVHSEAARVQRRHRAEQRAHMAPMKMIFPTVAFLMPAFFLVAMAPSVLSLMKVLGSLGK